MTRFIAYGIIFLIRGKGTKMVILASILVAIIVVGLIFSIYFLGAYVVFHFMPHLTDKIGGTVVDKKHKRDVVIRTRRGPDIKVDHVTKGVYEYKVGEKYYYKKYTHWYTTFNQAPYMIPIIYIKRFPKISYVNLDTAIGDLSYLIWGLFAFGGLVIIPFVLALALFF